MACFAKNTGKKGKVYFFSGEEFERYDVDSGKVDDGPHKIADGVHWVGLDKIGFTTIDAVTMQQIGGRAKFVFFRGDEMAIYDDANDSVDQKPKPAQAIYGRTQYPGLWWD